MNSEILKPVQRAKGGTVGSVLVAGILALGSPAALAANPTQDWPCVQVLQPELSVGSMWAGPVPDAATAELARTDAGIRAAAARLAQRRMQMEDAAALVAEFAQGADAARLTALFLAVFDRIDDERRAILAGISRYGHGQGALAERIEAHRAKIAALEAAEPPDFDAIDAEEEALDWDRRIFEERRLMLTAVCDTPVVLEKRLFELGRLIHAQLPVE